MKVRIASAVACLTVTAFAVSGCNKPHDQAAVPPATEATAAPAELTVVAPSPANASTAGPPTPQQVQNANDIQDNADAAALANKLAADPAALARQSAACGPSNQTMRSLYLTRTGPTSPELRRFKVACMAKDQAQDAVARKADSAAGGVKNTGSL